MHQEFIFVNQVTGPLFIDIVNVFAEKGHRVKLYTGAIEKTYAELDENIVVRKLQTYKRDTTLKRLVTWLVFFSQAFFYSILDTTKNTRIFFVSNPPIAPFLGFVTSRSFDVLIYDIYPDILTSTTSIKETSWLYKSWVNLNKRVYKKAKHVFTISEGMEKVLSKYVDNKNISVINCWADTDYIKPIPKKENKFIEKFELADKFIVMYSGNLGLAHDIESILKAAFELRDRKDIKFVVIGEGAKKKIVVEFVKSNSLKNVLVLTFQDQKMLPYSMTAADMAVITIAEGGSSYAVPSKTYYFLAASAVIVALAESDSELSNLVEKYKVGALVNPGNVSELVKFIESYKENNEKLNLNKQNARKASGNFTRKNAIKFHQTIFPSNGSTD